jgi:hypothetical protein
MPLKVPFNPRIIHTEFFPHYSHSIEINFGNCFKWAWIAYRLFNKVELWSNYGHAFIAHKDKFFDSETLDGAKYWKTIPTIRRSFGYSKEYRSPKKMGAIEFTSYWSRHNKINWIEFNLQIDKYLS